MQRLRITPRIPPRAKISGGESSQSFITLGRLAEAGRTREVRLDLDSEHVVAVVGKRGSGKTHTLGVLAEGLTARANAGEGIGRGDPRTAVLILDTLNLFQWATVPLEQASGPAAEEQRRAADKWKIKPNPLPARFWHVSGFAAPTVESSELKLRTSDLSASDWGRLIGADTMVDPMGQFIAEVHEKVSSAGWSDGRRQRPPIPEFELDDLLACITDDQGLAADFSAETRRAVRQRLSAFRRSNLFAVDGTSLDELVRPAEAAVLLLSGVPDDVRALIVFLLIRLLMDERAAGSARTKDAEIRGLEAPAVIPRTWLLIDEAQNVMPSTAKSSANQILTRYVREGRNFGLSLAISTQQPSAIDAGVMAQVDTLIAHTLTVTADIRHVLNNLKSSQPDTVAVGNRTVSLAAAMPLLERGICLLSVLDTQRTSFVEVRPRATLHGGFER